MYYCAVITEITLQAWRFSYIKVALGKVMRDVINCVLSGFFFILRIAHFKCCVSDISAYDVVIQYCKWLWIWDSLECKHVANIMQKWHPRVLCLNLWGCCPFYWPSFKVSVSTTLFLLNCNSLFKLIFILCFAVVPFCHLYSPLYVQL